MKSIYIINPLITKEFGEMTRRQAESVASPETQLQVVSVDKGPASIEYSYDGVIAAPYVVKKVGEVVDKADAIVINCFEDVAVDAAREITDVPIIGPGSSTMALAQLLGHNFSAVVPTSGGNLIIRRVASKAGITKLASVRAVTPDIPVVELQNEAKLVEKVTEAAVKAIEDDGAHVIVLGCTGMAGLADQVEHELADRGYNIPVVDPLIVALKLAEILADMKISHSRLTYPPPPEKERTGCD
ncbi:MAG: aspartate/glutamate racemase family protein [Dehalococcoidia bacterium]|nr:aspartate/glutamate racemase family protein [Dehalococcoidia bacterium]